MLYIGGTLHPYKMRFFAPRHSYRPSHWLTAIPMVQDELQMILELSSPRGNSKERKLLAMAVLSFLLMQEDNLRQKVIGGDDLLPLRLSWKERNFLDALWWGPRRVLTEDELSQLRVGMLMTPSFSHTLGVDCH